MRSDRLDEDAVPKRDGQPILRILFGHKVNSTLNRETDHR